MSDSYPYETAALYGGIGAAAITLMSFVAARRLRESWRNVPVGAALALCVASACAAAVWILRLHWYAGAPSKCFLDGDGLLVVYALLPVGAVSCIVAGLVARRSRAVRSVAALLFAVVAARAMDVASLDIVDSANATMLANCTEDAPNEQRDGQTAPADTTPPDAAQGDAMPADAAQGDATPPDAAQGDRDAASLDPDAALPQGCFAWSPTRRSGLCRTGHDTWQEGTGWTLEFLGDDTLDEMTLVDSDSHVELVLDAAQRETLTKRLAQGGYVPLGTPSYVLEPGKRVTSRSPEFVVEWTRVDSSPAPLRDAGPFDAGEETGAWRTWTDRITLRCGTQTIVIAEDVGSANSAEARLFVKPGSHRVLADFTKSRGEEGNFGEYVYARLVDLDTDCK